MGTLRQRQKAVQACMDRFADKPFEPGVRDCGKLAAHVLHGMGRKAKLLNGWRGKSWGSAVRYIEAKGFGSLVELVDAMGLERIAPAAALPGDLIAMPTDAEGFGCSLSVALDNGRVLGLNTATGLIEPMIPHIFVCAWRV